MRTSLRSPLVSVVVPTFNRISYLKSALASVFEQTLSDWELLIIDDGSTDGTADYVSGLTDQRVQFLTIDHCGLPAKVRNVGIANACGQYVAFLDSDDLWVPDKLERQTDLLARQKTAQWSYTHFTRIDGTGRPLSDAAIKQWQPYSGSILNKLITIDAIIAMPTVLVETQLLEQAGHFDPQLKYCEDYDLWFRLADYGEALAIPERLSYVRVTPDSYSRDRHAVHESWIKTYRKLARIGSREVRQLCRRQAADSMITLARSYSSDGKLGAAMQNMVRAFHHHPTSARLWREAAKIVPRVIMAKMGLLRTFGADGA